MSVRPSRAMIFVFSMRTLQHSSRKVWTVDVSIMMTQPFHGKKVRSVPAELVSSVYGFGRDIGRPRAPTNLHFYGFQEPVSKSSFQESNSSIVIPE